MVFERGSILLIMLFYLNKNPHASPIIETSSGKLSGTSYFLDANLNLVNKSQQYTHGINAWLGVPYAEKPIGELRFKRAEHVKNWEPRVLDATRLPNTCFQLRDTLIPNFEGIEQLNPNTAVDEDCLYLNIWAPSTTTTTSQKRKIPVAVWIYGGGFASGTSTLDLYDPRVFVAETELIFVSIQYRLNIFGFLYLDDEESAPGNMGLLDQQLALKWIHANIERFGGDNSKITIFGESAGAASVNFHLLSPLSWPLFNNGILESGTSLAPWAVIENKTLALERNTNVVDYIGCDMREIKEKIECLKKMDAHTLLSRADEYFYSQANRGIVQFTFLPVIDGHFLTDTPTNLLEYGKFKQVNFDLKLFSIVMGKIRSTLNTKTFEFTVDLSFFERDHDR
jgi:carboxylesterase type B